MMDPYKDERARMMSAPVTTPDKLIELALRIEQASEGSRELNRDIILALYPDAQVGPYVLGDEDWYVFHAQPLVRNKAELPKFTSSLDAAMQLVPEGYSGQIWVRFNEGKRHKSRAAVWSHNDGHLAASRVNLEVAAATPALAVTAACLRARSHQGGQNG